MKNEASIRDRVVELRRVPVRDLLPNPRNWRRHPPAQAAALRGALDEIGYADALLARETDAGLELIDGHLRAETTPDAVVPVLVLDVTAEESAKLLATLDPLPLSPRRIKRPSIGPGGPDVAHAAPTCNTRDAETTGPRVVLRSISFHGLKQPLDVLLPLGHSNSDRRYSVLYLLYAGTGQCHDSLDPR